MNEEITVENLDKTIAQIFPKFDPIRVYWSCLDDDEKSSYMEQALFFVSSIPLSIRRNEDETIKKAIAYCAVGFMNETMLAQQVIQQNTMQSMGAMQNMKFNKRYSAEMPMTGTETSEKKTNKFPSKKAYELLRPFMYGFFRYRG